MNTLPPRAPDARADPTRVRVRRGFALALAASVAVHLAFTQWPVEVASPPDSMPLAATITELPPPPKPAPAAAAPKAKPKARSTRAAPAAPPAAAPEPAAVTDADEAPASVEPAPEAVAAEPELPATPVEIAAPSPATPLTEKTLPPRVDLVYKGYLGRQILHLGDATYRFEHSGNQYRISSVGELRGLAALLYPGQGRVESRGSITSAGLMPYAFVFERTSPERREVAQFDWEAGVVTLHEMKTAALDVPTFDWLAIMWQYYFSPPVEREVAVSVATTRRVARYKVTREDDERIEWGQGEIDTVRWHRVSEDGRTDGYVWLAPSLNFIPVKMRYVGPRATFEAVLDSIRVDEALAQR